MATLPRSLRIPEELWTPAVKRTREEGTSVTAVVTEALREYLAKPAPRRRAPRRTNKPKD